MGLTDVFKADPNFLENEEKYKSIKSEILGDDESDESGGSSGSGSESDDESEEEGGEGELRFVFSSCFLVENSADFLSLLSTLRLVGSVVPNKHGIKDMTETNMINLRRTIYLTIMNSVSLFSSSTEVHFRVQVLTLPSFVSVLFRCSSPTRKPFTSS